MDTTNTRTAITTKGTKDAKNGNGFWWKRIHCRDAEGTAKSNGFCEPICHIVQTADVFLKSVFVHFVYFVIFPRSKSFAFSRAFATWRDTPPFLSALIVVHRRLLFWNPCNPCDPWPHDAFS